MSPWTQDQVDEHNARVAAAEAAARSALSHAVVERQPKAALERAKARKAPGLDRITVRFTGRRRRLLDPDNFAGSVKDLLDGLRHAQLLSDDSPWFIRMEVTQEKVTHKSQEMTLIEIEYPPGYHPFT